MQQRSVSIYESVIDTKGKTVALEDILSAIKNGKWKNKIVYLRSIEDETQQKEYKNKLPCFTPSGTFQDRKVLIQHTGIIVIDFDTKDNPGLLNECSEHSQALIEDEYTNFLFSSCRGDGLAVGVKIDYSKHLASFRHLEKYYSEKHELKVDKGCKDVTRLRFISYDPNLYINENSKVLQIVEETKELSNDDIVKKIIASGKLIGNDTYDEWVRIGFSLATEFGEAGRHYFHALSRASSKYDQEDCEKKYNNCMQTNRGEVKFGTLVAYAKQAGVDINGRFLQKNKTEDAYIDRNLSEEIREWIDETHGQFDYKSCDFDLDIKSKSDKTNRRQIFQRMKKENKIVSINGKNGWFRKVEKEVIYADYVNVKPSYINLVMPLGISNLVKVSPRAIIIVAGSTNAGKTTFLLNVVKANNHKFFYFNSEMSVNKFRGRLDDFGLPVEFWKEKMEMIERVSNISDAIKPNDINIIDYLESDWEKPWLAGNKIREIFDSLDQGIAIIGLQKKRDAPFPRGGEATLEKSQLAIGLDFKESGDFNTAEIIKAKEPATKFNPNFCICDYVYRDNFTTFVKINDWRRK